MAEMLLASLATSAGTGAAIASAGSVIGPITAAASGWGTLTSAFSLLSGVGSLFGAFGQIGAGQQESAAYKNQANQEILNARLEKVKAEDTANEIRRSLLTNLSTANAMFASRGIGLGSGTPETAKSVGATNASKNIEKAKFGGDMAYSDRMVNAGQLRLNAGASRRAGIFGAITTLASSRNGLQALIQGL